jgi:hypothetical protein
MKLAGPFSLSKDQIDLERQINVLIHLLMDSFCSIYCSSLQTTLDQSDAEKRVDYFVMKGKLAAVGKRKSTGLQHFVKAVATCVGETFKELVMGVLHLSEKALPIFMGHEGSALVLQHLRCKYPLMSPPGLHIWGCLLVHQLVDAINM